MIDTEWGREAELHAELCGMGFERVPGETCGKEIEQARAALAESDKANGYVHLPTGEPEPLCRQAVEEWVSNQGHGRCWYYPEIFDRLARILKVKIPSDRGLPSRSEFEAGCRRYQEEEYGGGEERA